ncbi:MAG: hypothetical protein ABI217_12260, partial [Chthoniobacterales bacterium]
TLGSSMDRITAEVSQANGMPGLINADGSAAAGPAAGIVFDNYVGGPYVVTNPGCVGLVASTSTFAMTFAPNAIGTLPIPKANDAVRFNGSSLRPLVNSSTPAVLGAFPPAVQPVSVTLKATLGQALTWSATFSQTAFLVHRRAIVVVLNNGRNELRLYPNVETLASSCDLTTSYLVLNNSIGTQNGENTPFTIVTQDGNSFLSVSMRIEDQQYNKVLAKKQVQDSNTFLRVDTLIRPRNFL